MEIMLATRLYEYVRSWHGVVFAASRIVRAGESPVYAIPQWVLSQQMTMIGRIDSIVLVMRYLSVVVVKGVGIVDVDMMVRELDGLLRNAVGGWEVRRLEVCGGSVMSQTTVGTSCRACS